VRRYVKGGLVLYPHEVNVWDKPVPAIRAESIAPFEAAMLDALVRARFQREPQRSRAIADYRQKAFVFYNGNAPYYCGKYEFIEAIRSLGYDAPKSVLVPPGEAEGHLDAIRRLHDNPLRFLKPLFGSKSWGLYVASNCDDALRFLAQQRIPYIVQEYVPPQAEWRYILHRTWADLQDTRMPSIRMAYEKLGPAAWGAGIERVQRFGKRISWLGLMVAYENHTGARLATFCVDLGFTWRGPVIYESQLPFGDPYNWLGKPGQYAVARRAFSRSLTWSGAVARGLA
jgi:hypothetical protein